MHPKLIAIRAGPFTWHVREDAAGMLKRGIQHGDAMMSLLAAPDRYLSKSELLIKNSDNVTIGRVPPASASDKGLILRRLNYGKWRHRLRDLFRPSRAQMGMLRGLALEAAGVPTPRALAFCEVRLLRWPVRAYLLTEEVSDALSLGWVIHTTRGVAPGLSRNLALVLAKLHATGFSHRDLKPSNILVDGKHEVALIDLDAVRSSKPLSNRQAAADLLRLARGLEGFPGITTLLSARFLRHYCRSRGFDWKHWFRLLKARIAT